MHALALHPLCREVPVSQLQFQDKAAVVCCIFTQAKCHCQMRRYKTKDRGIKGWDKMSHIQIRDATVSQYIKKKESLTILIIYKSFQMFSKQKWQTFSGLSFWNLLLFTVVLNVFRFWTVGWTIWDTWTHHLVLWKTVINIFLLLLIDILLSKR